ncbi:MAG: methyltransferase [Pelagimonas sp.]|jgi:16S rRNA (guanine1207-N2)-methyltransferase|nr:methyltransferase [Pelagimonas sp.]
MTVDRLEFATRSGLQLPEGRIALFGAPGDGPTHGLTADQCEIIQGFAPDVARWEQRGFTVRQAPEGDYAAAIITLPRARDLAEARIAQAAASVAPGGLVVVNGAKTDGIEAITKALKSRVTLDGQVSKAHGKCLWFNASDALAGWQRPAMSQNAEGDMTAPGIFSADASDPASRALAAALPAKLKGHVADLGAGWGWLSREILKHDGVKELHLVEADHAALDCARANVSDDRARFHWADATKWTADRGLDAVIMNPPFHTGRKAEPALGQAFITQTARILASHGQLWLVANRHLPYEPTLAQLFKQVDEVAGDSRFKILHAQRPSRRGR